jgi:hypothetical protein
MASLTRMDANEPLHIHDDLDLYVAGRLSAADSYPIRAHLIECEVCGRRLARAVECMLELAAQSRSRFRLVNRERRQEPRTSTNDPGSMRMLHPVVGNWSNVRILDASKSGIRVQTSEFIQTGSLVQLRIKNTIVLGEVRYCVDAGDGFYAGVQVQDLH